MTWYGVAAGRTSCPFSAQALLEHGVLHVTRTWRHRCRESYTLASPGRWRNKSERAAAKPHVYNKSKSVMAVMAKTCPVIVSQNLSWPPNTCHGSQNLSWFQNLSWLPPTCHGFPKFTKNLPVMDSQNLSWLPKLVMATQNLSRCPKTCPVVVTQNLSWPSLAKTCPVIISQNLSWPPKTCRDFQTRSWFPKTCHGIPKPVMVSQNLSWYPKTCHGFQKPVMVTQNLSWPPSPKPVMATQNLSWFPQNVSWPPKTCHGFPRPARVSQNLSWLLTGLSSSDTSFLPFTKEAFSSAPFGLRVAQHCTSCLSRISRRQVHPAPLTLSTTRPGWHRPRAHRARGIPGVWLSGYALSALNALGDWLPISSTSLVACAHRQARERRANGGGPALASPHGCP